MSRFWADRVHRLTPYVPGEQPPAGMAVKLSTNENPYPPSPRALEALRAAVGDPLRLSLVPHFPNLLVVQTLSKSRSLAGLRVGWAMGHGSLIEALTRMKDSFNSYPLDRLALAGATAAIEDRAHFEQARCAVMRTRDRLVQHLVELQFEVLPSRANFVFARHPRHGGAELTARLRTCGFLVRRFDQPQRIADFLRITIGTGEQCEALVDALREIVSHPLSERTADAAQ